LRAAGGALHFEEIFVAAQEALVADEVAGDGMGDKLTPATAVLAQPLDALHHVQPAVLGVEGPVASLLKSLEVRLQVELARELVKADGLGFELG